MHRCRRELSVHLRTAHLGTADRGPAHNTGFENPIFASIELDYSDADADVTGEAVEEASKELVYYELDLGLNHGTAAAHIAPCVSIENRQPPAEISMFLHP